MQGLWGSFGHAIEYVQRFQPDTPRLFMSLGSMFGNDYPESAISLLDTWRCEMREHDRMLIGMDGTTNTTEIRKSYHDEGGHFEKFIINGFVNSNRVSGVEVCITSSWYVKLWQLTFSAVVQTFPMDFKSETCADSTHHASICALCQGGYLLGKWSSADLSEARKDRVLQSFQAWQGRDEEKV